MSLKFTLIIITCLFVGIFCIAQPGFNVYCCLSCGEAHTMCRYNTSKPGNFCKGFITSKLSTNDKVKILTMHNKLRQQMALIPAEDFPTAANMREMEWDHQLEEIATRWNIQCMFFDYDLCRTTPTFHEVGQNIGFKRAFRQRGTAEGILQRWFNENAYIPRLYLIRLVNTTYYITRGSYSMLPERVTYADFGHFTQLVWAKSYKVGCSVVRQRIPPFFSVNLVCNYFPAGNYLFHPVYTPGTPCSACPEGSECSKVHPGLCMFPAATCKPNILYPPFCDKDAGGVEEGEEEEEEEEDEKTSGEVPVDQDTSVQESGSLRSIKTIKHLLILPFLSLLKYNLF